MRNPVFLSAEWRHLLMANYRVNPELLKPFVPCGTELDDYNGNHYVSLVGFLFQNTRVKGIAIPFHTTFEEVNLRFYVRYKDQGRWNRGVVFLKEMVPRRMISLVANSLYGENYVTCPMAHTWKTVGNFLHISYLWRTGREWNHIMAVAAADPVETDPASEEAFITEHYWGYTFLNASCAGVYEVTHPKWRIHPVQSYDIKCEVAKIYGQAFEEPLLQVPRSVFLAEGSPVKVYKGSRILS
jgi:uncharacterized protein